VAEDSTRISGAAEDYNENLVCPECQSGNVFISGDRTELRCRNCGLQQTGTNLGIKPGETAKAVHKNKPQAAGWMRRHGF
jgi:transcription initiation factor TFIIIB Brf1 subunit/transcription initiation factor TFIIB